ncbi:MAG: methylated-DNA--[protein]-cysteine S-methyltransferase [Verrucomicrobiae bacterium]|nr:methylated-DNA--[protein]-cysteine S-methyltransferase [Verrucomicrobiae bacterium]
MAAVALNVRLTCSKLGVCRVELLRAREPTTACQVEIRFQQTPVTRRLLKRADCWRKQLQRYLSGEQVCFRIPVDLRTGTPFQQKVWRTLQRIPYGQTRSYAWVARRIGQQRAARAVGAACAANPVPILVPCHRVLRSNGSLGGFSAGPARKRALLQLEQAGIRPVPSA